MDVIRDELGLQIPGDVSIVGYDDVPEASWKGYDLTTVSQCPEKMIEEAVAILTEQIEVRTVRKCAAVLPARLMIRSSAKLPK